MKGGELILRLLGIEKPWDLTNIKRDVNNKRLHVWVKFTDINAENYSGEKEPQACQACAVKSGTNWEDHNISWFHVGLGVYSTKIHTTIRVYRNPCREENCSVNNRYLGRTDLGVTDALAQQVVNLLNSGVKYSIVCDLFKIPLQTAWAVNQNFESGNLTLTPPAQTSNTKSVTNASTSKNSDGPSSLPNINSSAWERLLAKDNDFKTRSLSLKFMLTKTRSQVRNMPDNESRKIKIGELRQFFMKHQRILYKEIAQLDGWAENA